MKSDGWGSSGTKELEAWPLYHDAQSEACHPPLRNVLERGGSKGQIRSEFDLAFDGEFEPGFFLLFPREPAQQRQTHFKIDVETWESFSWDSSIRLKSDCGSWSVDVLSLRSAPGTNQVGWPNKQAVVTAPLLLPALSTSLRGDMQ